MPLTGALTVAEIRSMQWTPVLAALTASTAFMVAAATRQPTFGDRHVFLRFAAACVALGFVFASERLGGDSHAALPLPLRVRIATRWTILAAIWVPVGAALFVLGDVEGTGSAGQVVLESGTLANVGLLLGTVSGRGQNDRYGQVAASVLAAAFVTSWATPDRFSPWQIPGTEAWQQSRIAWTAALAASILALVVVGWDHRRR